MTDQTYSRIYTVTTTCAMGTPSPIRPSVINLKLCFYCIGPQTIRLRLPEVKSVIRPLKFVL